MSKRILLFTGEGKGKTTAALGMVLRAVGKDMSVRIIMFVKNDETVGELKVLAALPKVTVSQHGLGFIPKAGSPAYTLHSDAAQEALKIASIALKDSAYDMVVLDEICVAVANGLISEEQVAAILDKATDNKIIVMTGRGAPQCLVESADTVTEMRCIKHGYTKGIAAQDGVEF